MECPWPDEEEGRKTGWKEAPESQKSKATRWNHFSRKKNGRGGGLVVLQAVEIHRTANLPLLEREIHHREDHRLTRRCVKGVDAGLRSRCR